MMKRYIKQFGLIMGLGLTISFSGCSDDILSEITSLETSRLFSPTNVDVRVVNQTGVRLDWKEVQNAAFYEVDFFEGADSDFSGTPARVVTDINYNEVPYTVTGLVGETDYTVRVKAVGTDVGDSKWVTASFRTGAEQLFQTVNPADLEADQVILRWLAGEAATQIVLQPGNMTHTVTPEEIADGVALITGLTAETTYTATLLNDGRTRGTITFTTLIDLGGAILIEAGDDLAAAIAAADAGATLALMPGEYTVGQITIDKSISIVAVRPAERPVLKGAVLQLTASMGLTLSDLVIEGEGVNSRMISYGASGVYGRLVIENCNISGYVQGFVFINNGIDVRITGMSIQNNIIHDILVQGGEFIDFRSSITDVMDFKNNTVYNSGNGGRDFFRMDAPGSTNFPDVTSMLNVENNTFYNSNNGTANNNGRLFYIRLTRHQIVFSKNIIASSTGYYTNQSATTLTSLNSNNYFNAPGYSGSSYASAKNDTGNYTTFDPGFASPSTGDFTISHEELRYQQIGDPRWIR